MSSTAWAETDKRDEDVVVMVDNIMIDSVIKEDGLTTFPKEPEPVTEEIAEDKYEEKYENLHTICIGHSFFSEDRKSCKYVCEESVHVSARQQKEEYELNSEWVPPKRCVSCGKANKIYRGYFKQKSDVAPVQVPVQVQVPLKTTQNNVAQTEEFKDLKNNCVGYKIFGSRGKYECKNYVFVSAWWQKKCREENPDWVIPRRCKTCKQRHKEFQEKFDSQ
jgi:hypothetical protein